MKNKQKNRLEIADNKYNYFPPSPPPQPKEALPNSHYQSSSLPVGRPPPPEFELIQDDNSILQELKELLDNSMTQGEQDSSSQLLPSFIEQEGFDVLLFDDDNVSVDYELDLFPDLPSEKKS